MGAKFGLEGEDLFFGDLIGSFGEAFGSVVVIVVVVGGLGVCYIYGDPAMS